MKNKDYLLFDLDGTLTDPKEGITKAVQYALKHYGIQVDDLDRYARGTYRRYALIAGYVEVGETFEECVRREVMEEVGLKVKNIRYYKSQPWSFSDSVMIGFTADLDGDDTIRLEEDELAEAGWFSRDEIVEYPPYISVGHEMMKAFKDGTLFEDQG